MSPCSCQGYVRKGMVLQLLGNTPDAFDSFEKALSLEADIDHQHGSTLSRFEIDCLLVK